MRASRGGGGAAGQRDGTSPVQCGAIAAGTVCARGTSSHRSYYGTTAQLDTSSRRHSTVTLPRPSSATAPTPPPAARGAACGGDAPPAGADPLTPIAQRWPHVIHSGIFATRAPPAHTTAKLPHRASLSQRPHERRPCHRVLAAATAAAPATSPPSQCSWGPTLTHDVTLPGPPPPPPPLSPPHVRRTAATIANTAAPRPTSALMPADPAPLLSGRPPPWYDRLANTVEFTATCDAPPAVEQ